MNELKQDTHYFVIPQIERLPYEGDTESGVQETPSILRSQLHKL